LRGGGEGRISWRENWKLSRPASPCPRRMKESHEGRIERPCTLRFSGRLESRPESHEGRIESRDRRVAPLRGSRWESHEGRIESWLFYDSFEFFDVIGISWRENWKFLIWSSLTNGNRMNLMKGELKVVESRGHSQVHQLRESHEGRIER